MHDCHSGGCASVISASHLRSCIRVGSMLTYSGYFRRVRKPIWGAMALLTLLSLLQTTAGNITDSSTLQPSMNINPPSVILEAGTTGSTTIYANSTSAIVSIAPQNYTQDYVLAIDNAATDSWQIRLKKYSDFNINRLRNCTVYFHNSTDGTSSQISIQNGAYTQDVGTWYNLSSLTTVHTAITAEASSQGTSYVYVYLEILVPDKTTYAQYVVTFQIT